MTQVSDDGLEKILGDLHPYKETTKTYRRVPEEPVDRAAILSEIAGMAHAEDALGDKGTVSGSLYCGDHGHYHFLGEVFDLYSHANVLMRDMYPSATKFEGEIIAMTSDLLHGTGVGVVTSGGSESLMTALYSYREDARETRGVTRPNVVMPVTAHVALDKGAHWMDVELRHAPLTDGYVADVAAMADLVDDQTIAVVGSAGNYAHGLIASTWAALVATGESGYLAAADAIMSTAVTIRDGIRDGIPELEVIGDPLFLIAFKPAGDLDIYLVNDSLIAQGWRMIALQLPPALHFCVTRPNTAPGLAEAFLAALRTAVEYAAEHKGTRAKSGAVYGFGGTMLGNAMVKFTMARFLDAMHEVAPDVEASSGGRALDPGGRPRQRRPQGRRVLARRRGASHGDAPRPRAHRARRGRHPGRHRMVDRAARGGARGDRRGRRRP